MGEKDSAILKQDVIGNYSDAYAQLYGSDLRDRDGKKYTKQSIKEGLAETVGISVPSIERALYGRGIAVNAEENVKRGVIESYNSGRETLKQLSEKFSLSKDRIYKILYEAENTGRTINWRGSKSTQFKTKEEYARKSELEVVCEFSLNVDSIEIKRRYDVTTVPSKNYELPVIVDLNRGGRNFPAEGRVLRYVAGKKEERSRRKSNMRRRAEVMKQRVLKGVLASAAALLLITTAYFTNRISNKQDNEDISKEPTPIISHEHIANLVELDSLVR